MLRHVLLAAAAASSAAVPAPAGAAAILPVCATALVAAPAGTVSSCTSSATPVLIAPVNRHLVVEVAAGAVDASVTCGNNTATAHVTGPLPVVIGVNESHLSCTATIVAAAPGTTAVGLSTFVPTDY